MNFKPFSKKQLATLCWWGPDSPYRDMDAIICDGAVRSGKSLCMFVSFIVWAMTNFKNASFANGVIGQKKSHCSLPSGAVPVGVQMHPEIIGRKYKGADARIRKHLLDIRRQG